MNNDVLDAVETIMQYGAEAEAICILAQGLKLRLRDTGRANTTMKSQLRAIRKINKRENEAIDALCAND